MLITTGGVLIRTRVAEIREMGRSTQGVTLINLGEDESARRPGEDRRARRRRTANGNGGDGERRRTATATTAKTPTAPTPDAAERQ